MGVVEGDGGEVARRGEGRGGSLTIKESCTLTKAEKFYCKLPIMSCFMIQVLTVLAIQFHRSEQHINVLSTVL